MTGFGIGNSPIGGIILSQSVFHDAWSDPDDVYPYRRKNLNLIYPSVSDVPRIPAFFGVFFADTWATPNQVRYYPRKNYWWTQLPEVMQPEPGSIKILFADTWAVQNQVRYYPKKNFWWSLLPETYQSNPANIGLFYTDAWVDMPDVHYYPRKNYWFAELPELYQPEPGSIGILFTATWDIQNFSASRTARNFNFLNTNPIITPGAFSQIFDEFIIRSRRRGRR